MSRQSKPWYRAASKSWVTKVAGHQYTLARGKANRKAATKAFHTLMVQLGRSDVPSGNLPVWTLRDLFLEATEPNVSPESLASYKEWTGRFVRFVGRGKMAASVIPHDVTRWLQSRPARGKPCGRSTRTTASKRVKRMFGWAASQGLLDGNPLAGVKPGGYDQRQCVLTPQQVRTVLQAAPQPLKPYLAFLAATGCRPSEAAKLTAAHVDLTAGTATMRSKTFGQIGRLRVIYLTDEALGIIRPLMAQHPTGPLFRSSRGNAWFPGSLNDRFEALRKATGMGHELVPESFRHSFATQAAFRLLPAELAALMGSSVKTIARYYIHLDAKTQELRAAAERARG